LTTIAWQKTPTGPDQTCSRLGDLHPRRIWYTQNFQIFMYIFGGGSGSGSGWVVGWGSK
jgi:hypothetical protein